MKREQIPELREQRRSDTRRGQVWRGFVAVAPLVLAGTGCQAILGVDEGIPRVDAGKESGSGGSGGSVVVPLNADKIDLLLMVDNSRSMADKQEILVATVPDLVNGLVNPRCIDPTTMAPSAQQPGGPTDPCPDPAAKRDFNPVLDIHIGIVTSSLGGHGSDACPNSETSTCAGGMANTTNNDMGHLVSRLDPCTGGAVPTYQGKSFLLWDPNALYPVDTKPSVHTKDLGSLNIDTTMGDAVTTVTPGLIPDFKDMVLGTGQIGCGFEAQIESWYRFLVDPDPYLTIGVDSKGVAAPAGLDSTLLAQRKDFLRPDSLLAIIGLTDENDCSTKEYGQFYFVNQLQNPSNPAENFHLPKPRAECAPNPNDPCCRSCGQDQTGCPADPNCGGSLDAKSDDVNLRCWDNKRRFGIDFLYPIDRYVTGLSASQVPNRAGEMVQNSIFANLDPMSTASPRNASLVFLTYIVGVPWQDLAVDPNDLTKGFKDAAALGTADKSGHTTWDYIIGDPENYVPPLDPHMVESWAPRSGTDPLTGATLAPPTMADLGTDPTTWPDLQNGHEYTPGTNMGVQVSPDDLEYACVFDLPASRDCTDPTLVSCDCIDPKNDNPLCATNGAKGRTLQTHAKGYPGIRELSLVKALGSHGSLGSICPAQLTDLSQADFGYRPAIRAFLDGIKPALRGP